MSGTNSVNFTLEGGTFELGAGATTSGNVTFAGAPATLRFDSNVVQVSGNISGLALNDLLDFAYVTYATGDKAVWTQAGGSGTLQLETSGGTVLASLMLVGTYTSANFNVSEDSTGGTLVTDPPAPVTVAAGSTVDFSALWDAAVTFAGPSGTLQLGQSTGFSGTIAGFGGQDQIDLSDIAFTANTTLGYAANSGNTGGTLSVGNGAATANLTLLGQYMASSFVASSDGHGGTLVSEAALAAQATLTQPHHA